MNKKLKIENRKNDLMKSISWFERPWKGPWKGCLEPGAPPGGCSQRGANCQEQIFCRRALAGRANEICQGTAVAQAFGDAPKDGEPQTHDTFEIEDEKIDKKCGKISQKCPGPGFWYSRLGQVAKTISQRTPCVAVQPDYALPFQIFDIKISR